LIIKTRGIVVRAIKYSETSLIVDVLTEAVGLRTYIVSGVRQTKAKFGAALLQVPSLIDLVAYEGDDAAKMQRVKELRAAYIFQKIPFDIQRGAMALFMAEVLRRSIREHDAVPELFAFVFDSFLLLDQTSLPIQNFHLSFLVKLSDFFGFSPFWSEDTGGGAIFDLKDGRFTHDTVGHTYFMTLEQSELFRQLLNTAFLDFHTLPFNRQQRQTMLQDLLTFFQLHIEGMAAVQSHKILQDVLA
jgi:DNA repair protein RecO (recombination protein O)